MRVVWCWLCCGPCHVTVGVKIPFQWWHITKVTQLFPIIAAIGYGPGSLRLSRLLLQLQLQQLVVTNRWKTQSGSSAGCWESTAPSPTLLVLCWATWPRDGLLPCGVPPPCRSAGRHTNRLQLRSATYFSNLFIHRVRLVWKPSFPARSPRNSKIRYGEHLETSTFDSGYPPRPGGCASRPALGFAAPSCAAAPCPSLTFYTVETEANKGRVSRPVLHSKPVAELGTERRLSDSRSWALATHWALTWDEVNLTRDIR